MKRLYLMRHATAGTSNPADRVADDDPGLTPVGMTRARAADRDSLSLVLVLLSPLARGKSASLAYTDDGLK